MGGVVAISEPAVKGFVLISGMPVAEWVETPKLIVDPKAPSLPAFHPAVSIPGRSALRVVTKGFPAS